MTRETLFISHASPEDNPFVLWLSSRLQLLGYKVWCDLEKFKGGERDFWGRIEGPIRDESCKFIIVVSRHSMMSDGVLKEFHFAEQVAKEKSIHDFVFPAWVEKVPYTIRIGLSIYNKFNFEQNWATGLAQMVKKLEEDNVPKHSENITSLYKNALLPSPFAVVNGLKERYYTNWWPINDVPEVMYYFAYDNDTKAKAVFKEVRHYPVHRHGNVLVSFQSSLPKLISSSNPEWEFQTSIDNVSEIEILPASTGQILVQDVLNQKESLAFPTTRDSENFFKRLLWKSFNRLMYRRGTQNIFMSNKQTCFFFPTGAIHKNKVAIHYPKKKKKVKNLVGKQGEGMWHFGVSCSVQLKPVVCFNLKSHILFSDDGINIWTDAGKLHSARRKKGKTWFNEHWRDQLMAFLSALNPGSNKITLDLSDDFSLEMPAFTKSYITDFGYLEPKTNDRQALLNDFEDELEEPQVSSQDEVQQ